MSNQLMGIRSMVSNTVLNLQGDDCPAERDSYSGLDFCKKGGRHF